MEDSDLEYLRFYRENAQVYYELDEGRLYDGIGVDFFKEKFDDIESNLPINKDKFIDSKELDNILDRIGNKYNIDIDKTKLWVLSAYIYSSLKSKMYALLKPTAKDEMEMYNKLDTAYSITIAGTNEKGEENKVTLKNQYVVEKILDAIAEIDENNLPEIHEIERIVSVKEISRKTIFDFLFLLELENFFTAFKRKRLTVLEKELILTVMYLFRFYTVIPKVDNYRRLKSDYKMYPIRESINKFTDKDGSTYIFVLTFIKWKDWNK